jgi:ribonuclease inhibitor
MEVVLQGDDIRSEHDLHRILAEKLDFGPYYGANLAALWDRLTTDVERPVQLVWKNAASSRAAMGEALFAKLTQLLRDVEQQDRDWGLPNAFTFTIE